MRHLLRLGPAVALCLGLAACFTSPEPLIPAADAAFPFTRMVFQVADGSGDRQLLVREGDAYRMSAADEPGEVGALVRLKDIGSGAYVAQFAAIEGPADGKPVPLLYAVMIEGEGRADFSSYAAMKPDDFQPAPGLAPCERDVCVEDLDAYAAYAMARIDAGVEPDVVYRILELE